MFFKILLFLCYLSFFGDTQASNAIITEQKNILEATEQVDSQISEHEQNSKLSPAEEYRDMVEREKILADVDEDLPAPVFDKPSNLMVWVRSGGIYILCKLLDGKEWLMRKYRNIMREFKVIKSTL